MHSHSSFRCCSRISQVCCHSTAPTSGNLWGAHIGATFKHLLSEGEFREGCYHITYETEESLPCAALCSVHTPQLTA